MPCEEKRRGAMPVCLMPYSLSTWKMQMIFKFGFSVQAACIYPTATLKQVTNGNMCSFYFYKAGRTRDGGLSLWGLKSLFSGDVLLSGMMVILSGSSMAVAPTCLVLRSVEARELGKWPCLSLLSSQEEKDKGMRQDSLDSGRATACLSWGLAQDSISMRTRGWSPSASGLLVSQWSAFNPMVQNCPYVRSAGRSLKGDFPKASWSLLQPKLWKNQNDSIHDNISIKTPFFLLSAHCWFYRKDDGPLISQPLLLTPQSSEQESYSKEGEQDVKWDRLYKNDLIMWITGCRNLEMSGFGGMGQLD